MYFRWVLGWSYKCSVYTSARFKSYQFLKVVSGGRAPGKSSSFASSQLLVIERFHCFRAVRLETVQFLVSRWFLKLVFVHFFKGANAGCCLLAAACLLLLACCCLPAACCGCCLLLLAAACCLLAGWLACCLLAAACCLLACWLAGLLAACLLLACLLLAACLLLLAAACLPGWIGQQTFWELPTTLMHIAPAIDLAAENKGPPYPYVTLEIWGCTNRGLMWSRDAGHQYNIFKSNRNSCREFVCINLCPSKLSLCAMLRLLLTTSLIIDERGCAMVILLPWCDFPLPDVTFCIAAVPWGWCGFSCMMWLGPGARIMHYLLRLFQHI